MASVSAPARPRPASAPAVARHGKCSLELSIGGTRYRLQPITPPADHRLVWSIRKHTDGPPATYQVTVRKGSPQPACTCPDFEINGAVCKHIGALKALGLIPGRKARPAAARRSHARTVAEAAAPARPAAGPIAAGFRRAVNDHLARRDAGQAVDPDAFQCAACGTEFDPQQSRDPHFCTTCSEAYS